MKKKYLRALAKAAAVRAIKTVAQTAIATIGSAAVLGAVDWRIVVSASALAGLLLSKGKSKKTKGQHKNQKRRPLRLTAPGSASCFLRVLFQAAPRPAHLGNSKQHRRIFLLRRTE